MGIPNVSYKVEIAWTSNWKTTAGSRVWTDVSAYVELHEGIQIDYGRTDELSVADANSLTLTFDNSDGRFTWGNTSSPYYPNVKIGRPIRVTGTFEGVDYVRFVGFVNEWPVEWPGESSGYATATITASSRLAYIDQRRPLLATRTIVPLSYFDATGMWTLAGSAEGSNAAPSSPFGQMQVFSATGVEFGGGVGPTGPDDQVVKMSPGGALVASGGHPAADADQAFGASIWIRPTAVPSSDARVFRLSAGPIGIFFNLTTGMSPQVSYVLPNGTTLSLSATTPMTVGEGRLFVFSASRTSSTDWSCALNDSVAGSAIFTSSSGTTGTISSDLTVSIGWTEWPGFGTYEGAVSDVAIYPSAWASNAVASSELIESGDGWAGDSPSQRLGRIMLWLGLNAPPAVGSSSVTLAGLNAEADSAVSFMRQVEDSEGGVLHDDRDGTLTLKTRSSRYNAASVSISMTTDRVGGYDPKVDLQGMINLATVTGPSGSAVAEDASSREDYGDAAWTLETFAQDPEEPLQRAYWAVNSKGQPRPRTGAIVLNVLDWLGTSPTPLLFDVGTGLRLTNGPVQAPDATAAAFFIEGYSENITPGRWELALNLSPRTIEALTLVLDNAVLGKLDTNVLAL